METPSGSVTDIGWELLQVHKDRMGTHSGKLTDRMGTPSNTLRDIEWELLQGQ
jgi:hypothetical protein